MSYETMLTTFSSVIFVIWLWQSYLLTKVSRAASRATGLLEFMRQTNQFADLAEKLLEQNKLNCEVQCELVKDLQTLNERLSAYNERLNNMATTMRDVYGVD